MFSANSDKGNIYCVFTSTIYRPSEVDGNCLVFIPLSLCMCLFCASWLGIMCFSNHTSLDCVKTLV